MTLDEQISKDLSELYASGEISSAKELSPLITVSCKGLPQHFVGDRNAKTVFVMLNPGKDASKSDTDFSDLTTGYCRTNAKTFIESYLRAMTEFGKDDCSHPDPFDVKQAAFLKPWKNSGIKLPTNFPQDKESFRAAKEAVLTQKLQLELIPYCSSTFKLNRAEIKNLFPFVEILLDEIFKKKRTAVIFGSRLFENVFKAYNRAKGFCIDLSAEKVNSGALGPGMKISGNCRPVTLCWNGKTQKALIAHTIASQALCNAPHLMLAYGKFCYEQFTNFAPMP